MSPSSSTHPANITTTTTAIIAIKPFSIIGTYQIKYYPAPLYKSFENQKQKVFKDVIHHINQEEQNFMAVKGHLVKELDTLGEQQLREVVEYVAFLKFRSRFMSPPSVDEEELTKLYGEFAEEDRQLAEEGMVDYTNSLAKEDKQ